MTIKANGLKLLVTLSLLAYIISHANAEQVMNLLRHSDLSYVLLAVFLQTLSYLVANLRWWAVMNQLGFKARFAFYWSIYLIGLLFNQVLPSSVGGDGMRAWYVAHYSEQKLLRTGAAILVDRYYGIAGLLALAVISHFVWPQALPRSVQLVTFFVACALMVASLILWFLSRNSGYRLPLISWLTQLALVWRGSFTSGFDFANKLILAMICHAISFLAVLSLARALHISVGYYYVFAIMPCVNLFSLLPISLAAWGVRETAMLGLFAISGLSHSEIIVWSILFGLTQTLASMPGFYAYLEQRRLAGKIHYES